MVTIRGYKAGQQPDYKPCLQGRTAVGLQAMVTRRSYKTEQQPDYKP